MRSVFNRLSIGLATAVIVLAQVVMPAQAAFASKPNSNGMISNNKVTVCHRTSSGSNPYVQQDIADDAAANREVNKVNGSIGVYPTADWGDIIPPFTYVHKVNGTDVSTPIDGLNWTAAGQAIYNNDCNVPGFTTPIDGTFADMCGPIFNASFIETITPGVTYHPIQTGNTITVTATADANYTLTDPNWTQVYTDQLTSCTSSDEPATPTNGVFADKCGADFNLSFTPAITEGVTYHPIQTGNTITVTATADANYTLTDPNWTQVQTDLLTPCPTIKPCTSISTTTVSKYEDFADYNESGATGHAEFAVNGLHIWTEGATSTDKVAWYNLVEPYTLADIGTPSIDYADTTVTTNDEPGMQVLVDFNGDNIADGILVGESVYGNDWWLSNGSAQFAKDGAPSHTDGSGSANHGTLNEWLIAFPNAKVLGVGFSLGSGVKGDGVLHSLTFGCQTWVFAKEVRSPQICTLKEGQVFDKPWGEGKNTYPSAEDGGIATFDKDKGIFIQTPTVSSSVYGLIDAGNTYLTDINKMSYEFMRDASSTGNEQTTAAYILHVDMDGNLATTADQDYLFYEPIYNGPFPTGAFVTRDVINSGDAVWWGFKLSGGNPSYTWSQILAQYPDAIAMEYGFNQGSSNQGTNSYLKAMTFDCQTTAFTAGKGGAGGGNGGGTGTETPPSNPGTPVVTVTPGKGSVVPQQVTELPETGAGTNALMIGLLASAAAYGAVYFAQPKRRYE